MVKIVVFGHKGQLGAALVQQAPRYGVAVVGADRPQCDIGDVLCVSQTLADAGDVDLVINAAAYTAVDRAESEPALVYNVNRDGAGLVARDCQRRGIPMIHISTDYVFEGMQTRPYRPEDPVAPKGVYAQSKAEGEVVVRHNLSQHLILRVSWLFSEHGANFVKTILRLGREHETVRVVDDQIGSPTYARDLADALLQMALKTRAGFTGWGTYHYCNQGALTWYAFARKIFALARPHEALAVQEVISILTSHYPTPAPRPHYSVLDCTSFDDTFNIARRPWQEALKQMVDALYANPQ